MGNEHKRKITGKKKSKSKKTDTKTKDTNNKLSSHKDFTDDTVEFIRQTLKNAPPEIKVDAQKDIYFSLYDYVNNIIDEFPKGYAYYLMVAMESVLKGETPELLITNKKRGERTSSPVVRSCIKSAVTYMKYARAGLIKDSSPNKTVAKIFDVKTNTVSTWLSHKNVKNIRVPTKASKDNIEGVINSMQVAGEHYPNLSTASSHKAIRKRASGK